MTSLNKIQFLVICYILFAGCTSLNYQKTVDHVDLPKYMGTWYVWAGRTTSFEKGAFAAIEKYTWNNAENRVDVDFTFHKDSFEGPLKSIPQKAFIDDTKTNAHWLIQPFWPLKFDYLIIDIDTDYQWVVVGVPSGDYIWIMGRTPKVEESQLSAIIERVKKLDYPVKDIERVPQR